MEFDPFADDTPDVPDEAQTYTNPWDEQSPAPAPEPAPVPGSSDHRVRVTLKAGSDYAAPWVTVDGHDVRDALGQISDWEALRELLDRAAKVGAYFVSKAAGTTGQSGQAGQRPASASAPPQGSQEAPGGEKRYCEHGEMIYRSGISAKNGAPYRLFSCPNTNRDQQCKPQWLR
ncbi:hypothetical protein [Kutzneria chonburiensis]|uniref:Uncharacterized protein n=1 Tax=Kutzneria chonburiensis TaxID=1483604 RepID=A0ABV6N457_9PSEU|nr:hypothetical protein [Kutzneria chonburiensis]